MNFHPVVGERRVGNSFGCGIGLGKFDGYDEDDRCFFLYGGYGMYTCLPPIGDAKPRNTGDSYPEHWNFDPETGEQLRELPEEIVTLLNRLH